MLYRNIRDVRGQNLGKYNVNTEYTAAAWVSNTVYLVVDVDPVGVFAGAELQTVVHRNRVVRLLLNVNVISYQRERERERDMMGKL